MNASAIEEYIRKRVSEECDQCYRDWRSGVIALTEKYKHKAPGLLGRTQRFCEESNLCFYKRFEDRLSEKLKTLINDIQRPTTAIGCELSYKEQMRIHKDRIMLEAYLLEGGRIEAAASKLEVSRETFYRWTRDNEELIISEKNKTE